MAVRDDLTERIRRLVVMDPRVTEKRMFGGICFLLDGKILVAARRTGAMMAQIGAETAAQVTQEPGVTQMMMRGRAMAAFVDVEGEQIETEEGLRRWINLAERYVASKPVKG